MTSAGLIGIILSLLAYPFAFANRTWPRSALFLILLAVHIASATVYYQYALSAPSDSEFYYSPPGIMNSLPGGFGTIFVIRMTQFIRELTGATYLDMFLIFQTFGFWGLVFLMRIFEEIYSELELGQAPVTYLALLLPGLHFWTSSIGKDGALFFGASLAVWSAIHIRTRFPAFVLAVAVMLLFRPHIALVAVIALAMASTLDPRAKGYVKFLLLSGAGIGAVVVAGTVETSFNINLGSAESIGNFFARQSEVGARAEGATSATELIFPLRVISLLFRPLFFDIDGIFGQVASFENVFMIIIFGTIIRNFRTGLRLAREVFFLRFSLIFVAALILLLSMVYYNVGLGLRQRVMFMPGLLAFFAAVIAVRRARRSATVLVPA